MTQQNDDFLKRLLATFRIEAEEHLNTMSSLLLTLEGSPDADSSPGLIETLFREAHSLKGAARAVNLLPVESVCQALEDALAGLKRRSILVSAELFDVLHQVLDGLRGMLAEAAVGKENAYDSRATDIRALLGRGLEDNATSVAPVVTPPPAKGKRRSKEKTKNRKPEAAVSASEPTSRIPAPVSDREASAPTETVRIAADKLDALLLQTEEMLALKHAIGQRADELRALSGSLKVWEKEWSRSYRDARSVGRTLEKFSGRNGAVDGREANRPQVTKLIEGLEHSGRLLKSFDNRVALLARAVEQDHRILDGMVDSLLRDTKKMLMLPFASLLEMFPKLVRDLSRDKGREAEILIQGAEIRIDKRILEELKDPLIHLVRNAIDHGIEDPAERKRKGKPARGTLSIIVTHKNGSKIDIVVADDGAGIDAAKVESAAAKLGVIAREGAEELSETVALSLIFRSGVSTSPIITDLSGRGLGLAIVREKVEKLGGTVSVETQPDAGTLFRIVLPLTFATVRGLLVQVAEHIFVLPATNVARVMKLQGDDIKTVENRESIQLDGQTLALVRLADVLELPRRAAKEDAASGSCAIILGLGPERIAFRVDAVQGEQEILVKGFGAPLVRVRNSAGATVLGTGRVVPILNITDLMKSAVKVAAAPASATVSVEEMPAQRKLILVAEDSVTARTLVKNILEAAGYDVKTAVDGAEAFSLLKTEKFDLVVSDVEMPRMDGFDLTAKIRTTRELTELPVVLVTALESREHRERGIDAGANAYIVKSSFDQSNLLEVIGRLI